MEFQARKADSQTATCYDNVDWVYQVNEPGGTTQGGVQHGGRAFRVSLKTCECTCRRPSLLHLACSHLLTAARTRRVDYNNVLTVRESEFSIEATKRTWAPRFSPYLDQSQWPEYHGVQVWPDPEWKVVKRGRRKTKRYHGDMDRWGHSGNKLFQEAREPTNCGSCNSKGHNRRKCSNDKKSKGNDASTSQQSSSQQASNQPPSHESPSQQAPSHESARQQAPPQQAPRQQAPRQPRIHLGLTRGRHGGRRGASMIGYLAGPFPYVSPIY